MSSGDMERGDGIRRLLYLFFTIFFAYVMYNSLRKLFDQSTAFTQVQRTAPTMLYPSVTMCPINISYQAESDINRFLDQSNESLLIALFHSYEGENR